MAERKASERRLSEIRDVYLGTTTEDRVQMIADAARESDAGYVTAPGFSWLRWSDFAGDLDVLLARAACADGDAPERYAQARVRAAVERACVAVCPECALGKKARAKVLFGYPAVQMHLSDGYPPRECKAAAIRAAFTEEER